METKDVLIFEVTLPLRMTSAIKKNPALRSAFETLSRDTIERFFDSLPKCCPKRAGRPHVWETNYDETFCRDCGMDIRGRNLDEGETYVEEIVLHHKTQDGQPYGSVSRKCSECGCRLWVASDGTWTDDKKQWKEPPPGYVNCYTRLK